MPNELCAAGGGGVGEAPRVSLEWPDEKLRLKGSRAAEATLLPRLEGRRGSSSNCKVKPTPPVIVSLCVLSPFISPLIPFRKNKDMTTSLTPRPSAVHFTGPFAFVYMLV